MRRTHWATYLWPGLPQLWFWGFGSGWILATGFAALLNLLLLASFVWVELLSPLHLRLGWLSVGLLWAGSTAVSIWYGGREPAFRGTTSTEGLFRQALNEYLLGSWIEAEMILGRLLSLDPRDVEARLLLATLLRHTRRYPEALDQLDRLDRLRDAKAWAGEIAAERRWIAELETEHSATSTTSATDTPSQEITPQAA